jgi:hypothetical protein
MPTDLVEVTSKGETNGKETAASPNVRQLDSEETQSVGERFETTPGSEFKTPSEIRNELKERVGNIKDGDLTTGSHAEEKSGHEAKAASPPNQLENQVRGTKEGVTETLEGKKLSEKAKENSMSGQSENKSLGELNSELKERLGNIREANREGDLKKETTQEVEKPQASDDGSKQMADKRSPVDRVEKHDGGTQERLDAVGKEKPKESPDGSTTDQSQEKGQTGQKDKVKEQEKNPVEGKVEEKKPEARPREQAESKEDKKESSQIPPKEQDGILVSRDKESLGQNVLDVARRYIHNGGKGTVGPEAIAENPKPKYYEDLKRYNEAKKDYERYRKMNNEEKKAQGKIAKTEADVGRKWLKENPNHPDASKVKAQVEWLERFGKPPSTKDFFKGDYATNRSDSIKRVWDDIGRSSTYDPIDKNTGQPISEKARPWCGAFAASVYVRAGILDVNKDSKTIGAMLGGEKLIKHIKENGLEVGRDDLKSGDLFVTPKHVRIVDRIDEKGAIHTIEGNTWGADPLRGVYNKVYEPHEELPKGTVFGRLQQLQ